ncbi:hypothetical protein, partial [Helicobacter pylori]|uniref:hypothetical protein n=1 Tax=Helicobacter pylori TaxID=210 RepID=UPI002929A613
VILNPLPPNIPHQAGYCLPSDKEDTFSYLKGLAKDELDYIAPPRPAVTQKRTSSSIMPTSGNSNKRGKSEL